MLSSARAEEEQQLVPPAYGNRLRGIGAVADRLPLLSGFRSLDSRGVASGQSAETPASWPSVVRAAAFPVLFGRPSGGLDAVHLEDYALIGDMQSAALVGRGGVVDWLCLPRFDSPSCFAALLGDEGHGRWLLAPAGEVRASSRR